MATNYPLIMQEYAECSAEQVMKKYSRKEYFEISKKTNRRTENIYTSFNQRLFIRNEQKGGQSR